MALYIISQNPVELILKFFTLCQLIHDYFLFPIGSAGSSKSGRDVSSAQRQISNDGSLTSPSPDKTNASLPPSGFRPLSE